MTDPNRVELDADETLEDARAVAPEDDLSDPQALAGDFVDDD
jgi:hypothetical protein